MKDLTIEIEEKAKRYDEAIERAKNFIENGDERERTIAESIFAGLMEESEDEGIREELLSLFKDGRDGRSHRYTGSDCERYIDWLEKQGEKNELKNIEQKSAWSEEDEKMINSIIKNLDEGEWFDIYQADWLKSLKERV